MYLFTYFWRSLPQNMISKLGIYLGNPFYGIVLWKIDLYLFICWGFYVLAMSNVISGWVPVQMQGDMYSPAHTGRTGHSHHDPISYSVTVTSQPVLVVRIIILIMRSTRLGRDKYQTSWEACVLLIWQLCPVTSQITGNYY